MNAVLAADKLQDPLDWLNSRFDAHFWCVLGPPRAYFELEGNDPLPNPPEVVGPKTMGPFIRVVYQTFVMQANEDTPENRQALVELMWDATFEPYVSRLLLEDPGRVREDTLLFWRLKPNFAPLANGGIGLRFRLAVPGVKIAGEFRGSY